MNHLVKLSLPNILSFLSIPVSGRGSLVDADMIMTANMPTVLTIEGIGFYTSNVDGEWEFTEVEDRTMDIYVPQVYSHTNAYVLTNGYNLQFRVRAQQDARVMLMQVMVFYSCVRESLFHVPHTLRH